VARCIVREVKEGRGSPHGGVFLDIAWIKEKFRTRRAHQAKLPSMYHQFKQLADIDITKVPMEIGPTTHYVMGGVLVDGDTQMSTCRACSRPANAAAGLHGANRLGGNSLSDLLGVRQARRRVRGEIREGKRAGIDQREQVDEAARKGAGAVRARRGGRESVRQSSTNCRT
jgi:succinate dehydrogenase / fumarate reductase flavoprotein subunit